MFPIDLWMERCVVTVDGPGQTVCLRRMKFINASLVEMMDCFET